MRFRAIRGSVQANSPDPKSILANLQSGFEDFKKVHDERTDNFRKAADDINAKLAAGSLAGTSGNATAPVDPEYTNVFSPFFHYGDVDDVLKASNHTGERQQIQAAMSGGSAPDAGYLAPVEWDRNVLKKMIAVSPMRRLAEVCRSTIRRLANRLVTWVGRRMCALASCSRPSRCLTTHTLCGGRQHDKASSASPAIRRDPAA